MKTIPDTPLPPAQRRRVRLAPLAWGLLILAFILPGLAAGTWFGSKLSDRQTAGQQTEQLEAQIAAQYELGLAELEADEYNRAAQRFEWILLQDPNHEGAIEHLAEALVHVYVDQEKLPDPLEPVPTETVVYYPAEAVGLLSQAEAAVAAADWTAALDALTAVRQADPTYETVRVDRMLFLALRQRGVQLILSSELEGGLYLLSLAERFAPLDVEADTVRSWARLYLIGASFWNVFPDRSAYYFGQLADAAPYLSDRSGIPAIDRYVQALVQYGNQLFDAGEWCAAAEQYGLAQDRSYSTDLEERAAEAASSCENPEGDGDAEPSPEPTATATPDLTTSPTAAPSESLTPTPETATPEATVTPIVEITPTPTETPTEEITPAPTETPSEGITPTPGG